MDKSRKPLVARILAATAALALIGLIAFVTNSFTGNPISAFIAGQQMTKYVRQKFPDMMLQLSKAEYNFKSSGYALTASSPTSPDTHFIVTRRSNGRISDGYQDYVLSGHNTVDRLGREMTKEIEPLLKALFGNQLAGRCFADLFGEYKELPKFPLDTPFKREMKIPATIYIDFDVENPMLDDAAAKLRQADELLKKEGFTVRNYIVELMNRDKKRGYMIQVHADLVNDSLTEALKSALDSKDHNDKLWVNSMR